MYLNTFCKNELIIWIIMKTMIKYLRQELKMSQKELGDKVGVTRQTINSLENGRYNPSLFLAHDITRVLNKMIFKENREEYFVIEDIFIFDDY
ncbi:HTH domain-containing protein [Methanobrevibacter millerae]|uniref:HTH domain-containing protein n=2 Tax=Methanobrevibacter millerae TaxID=230361 RepID=A0A0U2TS62_9EURY|nr:HTH domain-containing protein [Methanobrevibacter millerae]